MTAPREAAGSAVIDELLERRATWREEQRSTRRTPTFAEVVVLPRELDSSEVLSEFAKAVAIPGLPESRIETVPGADGEAWTILVHDEPGDYYQPIWRCPTAGADRLEIAKTLATEVGDDRDKWLTFVQDV